MIKELLYYFEGLDESILKLNDYIFEDDFEFVKFTLKEFETEYERRFRQLIPNNHPYGFWTALYQLRCFNNNEIIKNDYVIFLKDKRNSYLENELDKRLIRIISNLKFFKSGHIKLISIFEFPFEFEADFVGPIITSSPSKKIINRYCLNNNDLLDLKFFKNKIELPSCSYLDLAVNSFLESYNIENEKLKFVTLMVCLESIFNIQSDIPIKHTISRHAALTITRNKNDFRKEFEKIKSLYNLRSSIVHGRYIDEEKYKKDMENVSKDILELERIVRSVLKQLIFDNKLFDSNTPNSKDELFKLLNESSPIDGFTSN